MRVGICSETLKKKIIFYLPLFLFYLGAYYFATFLHLENPDPSYDKKTKSSILSNNIYNTKIVWTGNSFVFTKI